MRPEVAQKREIYASGFICEGSMRRQGIATYAQHLGTKLPEPTSEGLDDGELAASDRCPVEWVEEENHVLTRFAVERREGHEIAEVGGEGEIWCRCAYR